MADNGRRALLEGLSHELRAPLQTLLGQVDLLAGGAYGPLTEEQNEAVGSVQRSAEKILTIANDVLEVVRIEAGHEEVLTSDVVLDELLEREVEDARERAVAKGLSLTLECPTGLTVRSDGAKLARIVANLLGNAIKYTQMGGVTVRASATAIEIEDTGIGIPAEHLNKVFDAYVRLDATQPGTGLGLAIVRGLARLLDAKLTMESETGRGTTVRVELA